MLGFKNFMVVFSLLLVVLSTILQSAYSHTPTHSEYQTAEYKGLSQYIRISYKKLEELEKKPIDKHTIPLCLEGRQEMVFDIKFIQERIEKIVKNATYQSITEAKVAIWEELKTKAVFIWTRYSIIKRKSQIIMMKNPSINWGVKNNMFYSAKNLWGKFGNKKYEEKKIKFYDGSLHTIQEAELLVDPFKAETESNQSTTPQSNKSDLSTDEFATQQSKDSSKYSGFHTIQEAEQRDDPFKAQTESKKSITSLPKAQPVSKNPDSAFPEQPPTQQSNSDSSSKKPVALPEQPSTQQLNANSSFKKSSPLPKESATLSVTDTLLKPTSSSSIASVTHISNTNPLLKATPTSSKEFSSFTTPSTTHLSDSDLIKVPVSSFSKDDLMADKSLTPEEQSFDQWMPPTELFKQSEQHTNKETESHLQTFNKINEKENKKEEKKNFEAYFSDSDHEFESGSTLNPSWIENEPMNENIKFFKSDDSKVITDSENELYNVIDEDDFYDVGAEYDYEVVGKTSKSYNSIWCGIFRVYCA